MGDEAGGISSTYTLVTIWLTLISGAVLLSLARSYLRDTFTPLFNSIPLALPTKLPPWMKVALGIAFWALAIIWVVVGGKAIFTYVSEPVLRVQVYFAAFLSIFWVWQKMVNAAQPVHWNSTIRLLVPMFAGIVLALSMVAYTRLDCPTSWARQWWVPCL